MKIRWSPEASSDLINIIEYIRQDSPEAAIRIGRTVYKAISDLAKFTNLGRPGRVKNTRELPLTPLPFLAVYRLSKDGIEIARILHGAQRWP